MPLTSDLINGIKFKLLRFLSISKNDHAWIIILYGNRLATIYQEQWGILDLSHSAVEFSARIGPRVCTISV